MKKTVKFSILGSITVILGFNSSFSAQAKQLISPPPPFIAQKANPSAPKVIKSQFTNSGIQHGNKAIHWHASAPLNLTLNEQELVSFFNRATTNTKAWRPFISFKNDIDTESKSVKGIHKFPLNKAETIFGTFQQDLKLLDNGKVKITYSWNSPEGAEKDFINIIPALIIPKHFAAGKELHVDNYTVKFPSNQAWEKEKVWINMLGRPECSSMTFNPQDPQNGFKLEFPNRNGVVVFRSKTQIRIHLRGQLTKANGKIEMILNFLKATPQSKTGDSVVAGINFSKCDNLNVPVFDPKGNLLLNPSFESGTRYTQAKLFGTYLKNYDDLLSNDAKFGKKSCIVESMGLFTTPILPNKPYTFSFYAKTLDEKTETLNLFFQSYNRIIKRNYLKISGKEWKRYERTFTLPNSAVKVILSNRNKNILVDGMQLEQGSKATAYKGNKLGLELITNSPDGMIMNASKPVTTSLIVRGPTGESGSLHVTLTDFFRRKLVNKTLAFNIPESGEQQIKLPIDETMGKGSFVASVDVKPNNLPAYSDYFRLTRMTYVGNTAKNCDIHSSNRYGNHRSIKITPDSELQFLQNCGIRALTYYYTSTPNLAEYDKLKKHNLKLTNLSFIGRTRKYGKKWTEVVAFQKSVIDSADKLLKNQTKTTPELLKRVENDAYKTAQKYSFLNSWYFASEPECSWEMLKKENFNDWAKLTAAFYKGFKKGNPNATVWANGGPCNMEHQGITGLDKQLTAAAQTTPATRYDAMAIHTYRPFPEQPDFDTDLQKFLAMLKKHNYTNVPIYLNEGAYFYPLNVPVWLGIAPWQDTTTKDKYIQLLNPTYDMGWAERAGAAMLMRYWLVCYKHMDRVKMATPWLPLIIDNQTPFAWLTMTSAMVDILGNTNFKKEIRFAADVRSYIFEDANNRPIATVQYWTENLDRGKEAPPEMLIDLEQINPEFIDMLGNTRAVKKQNGKYKLPISNFPFYIRCQAGEYSKLCAALEKASLTISKSPLQFMAKLKSKQTAEVIIANTLSKPFDGSISVSNSASQSLQLGPMKNKAINTPLKTPVPYDNIKEISLPISIKTTKATTEKDINLTAFAVKHADDKVFTIDANTNDWQNYPAIPVSNHRYTIIGKNIKAKHGGDKDFKASYKMAWNEGNLYLLIEVTDDTFILHDQQKISQWYNNDAVQLFIDTLGDGPTKGAMNSLGFDTNDYSYELLPTSNNSAVAYRRFTVDHQYTGGVGHELTPNMIEPGIKVAFKQQGNKQIYEAKFPGFYLRPFELKANNSAGFAIMIFDRDSKEHKAKQILMNTPIPAFKRPDAYPAMLLTK